MTKISHDSETPAHGQQVMSVCAFIHHDFDGISKVFLPKRADIKKFLPGVYELPGGHVDFGEDLVPALQREIEEEMGMRIRVGDPYFVYAYQNKIKGSHTIEVVYFAQFSDSIDRVRLNPEDHSRYDWLTLNEAWARRDEATLADDQIALQPNDQEDPEFVAIRRGFELLAGAKLDTAR